MPRLYHIVCLIRQPPTKTYMTRFPMSHDQCMVMLPKLGRHPTGVYMVEEVGSCVRADDLPTT